MGRVGGVLLDDSVLFTCSDNGNGPPVLRPGAVFLFQTFQFSKIGKGICVGNNISTDKVNLLKEMSKTYSFDCFSLSSSSVDAIINEIAVTYSDAGLRPVYVISRDKKNTFAKICNNDVVLMVVDDDDDGRETNNHPNIYHIKKLEELPLYICRLNKKAIGNDVVTVAYSMKLSRQVDFAKRGAFPLYCAEHELMFLPLTYELSIPFQLQEIDVVLHKATDDIVSIELNASLEAPKITYTDGMEELRRTLEDQQTCVIDPINNIYPVLDRLKIQHVLQGLEDLKTDGHSKIRGPRFLKVDDFNDPNLAKRLLEVKLSPPSIVKPQVACGVSNAHSMAIVFQFEDCKDLPVPLPAIMQEYVDHSSTLFKFYVVGEELFHAVKKSIPNADSLMKLSEANQFRPLVFDSLKSLPTAEKNQLGEEALDLELVKNAASFLRRKLDLTIFGFDVVIQEGANEHVIVDVNYLPSFKEVPDDIAIPAFWKAIKNKFLQRKREAQTK